MYMLLNLCILILLPSFKTIECLRRLGFINPRPCVNSYNFHNRIENAKSKKLDGNLNSLQTNKKYRDSKLLATTTVDKQEPIQDSNFFDFLSFTDYLNTRFIFSEGILDFTKDELIDRQIEHKKLSRETSKNVKKCIAVVFSAFALGLLYKFAFFVKNYIEHQSQSLGSFESVSQ